MIDPRLTRSALAGGEALFLGSVANAESLQALQDLGLPIDLSLVNFVTRSAPMGPVPAAVTVATFFNFNPEAVERIIPVAWEIASPATILTTHLEAFGPPLARALAPLPTAEVAEFASLMRTAADAILDQVGGRPLFAGLTSLPWPDGDHLVAFHAGKLLREHRGDAHVAALVADGLSGIEALAIHEAFEPAMPAGVLRRSRFWRRPAWDEAIANLVDRGWLAPGDGPLTLTAEGQRRRQEIEDLTDELAAPAFESLGPGGVDRLITIGAQVAAALAGAGLTLDAVFKPLHDAAGS